jgi:hypothetical protein
VIVNATATQAPPTAPTTITKLAGDGQTINQYSTATWTVSALVTDVLGNTVPNALVSFLASSANGALAPITVSTSADGVAVATLGYVRFLGPLQMVATVQGVSPVLSQTFSVNVSPTTHAYDGVYNCAIVSVTTPGNGAPPTSFVLENGMVVFYGGDLRYGSVDEVTGNFLIHTGANFSTNSIGQILIDAQQNATLTGTYQGGFQGGPPYNWAGTWACTRSP